MKLCTYIILAAAAWGQVPHQHHPPSSEEYAKVLEDPSRDEWQKPHDVVMALDIKPTDTIADIGAGTGYFARRFTHHAGKVYGVLSVCLFGTTHWLTSELTALHGNMRGVKTNIGDSSTIPPLQWRWRRFPRWPTSRHDR
jgi:hypothetical protein